ncbi:hypothetical protein DMH12_37345 [Streptomyces sp. WAC 04229]|uniref:hypothetical protein n=1 Tax=Streptomyces sp. WAC 04229 TaxID=2203206 RepID=UPI000F748999|nr:hypothetical protein [Streptomyces sp. WAC 04229]RSN38788.1 hypothetical protein DMH12_37345 [Streptomyces sp. WAC 04229]
MSTRTPAQKRANAHMQTRRRRLQALGQWKQPFVDAQPVRDHVNRMRAAGMPIRALEKRLGLSAHHLDHLLFGSNGFPPGEKFETEPAELILAFWPTLDDLPDPSRVDATGTLRRVQAMETRGFPRAAMARQLGFRKTYFQKAVASDKGTARMARAVRGLYGMWWDADPSAHDVPDWVAERTRRAADRQGFHGPLAWDDDTIDDPTAVPQTDAPAPAATDGENLAARWLMGESVILGRTERREVLQHLFEWTTDTTEQIAARLEMTPEAAERQWHRLQQRAAADGRRLWRRAWAYRDKNLTKNEMGEAA